MFELAGLATGIIGGIGKLFGRGSANRKLEALQKQDPKYSINPIAQQRYGLAQTLLNARMPGASSAEKNIATSQANFQGNVNRNAASSAQALALGGVAQGQADNAYSNLATQEAQDYQRRFGNYSNAGQGLINEGDKVFEDDVRRFGNKMQIQGAKNQNNQANWGDISRLGFGMADFGMSGGSGMVSGLFGGGGGQYQPNLNDISGMQRMPYNPQKY